MKDAKNPEQIIADAKAEYEREKSKAKAKFDKIKARQSTAARKLDTRRKVIAGGALFDLASRDAEASRVLNRLLDGITRENDKKAFEGWAKPETALEPSQGEKND